MNTYIKKLESGLWQYRIVWYENGVQKNKRGTRDEFGNPNLTKKQAVEAQKRAIEKINFPENKIERKTVAEVFEEYRKSGRIGKSEVTIRKEESLWKNHINPAFGKRYVEDIEAAEINNFLANLYYEQSKAYSYSEGFLKFFYKIFGQAYSTGCMSINKYNKLCVNKNSKIRMPSRKVDDDSEIVTFSKSEVKKLDEYFKNTNLQTAYLIGKYCGVRIGECFGLAWDMVDLEAATIRIERQLQHERGIFVLKPPKTRNARRTIYLSDFIVEYLKNLKKEIDAAEKSMPQRRKQQEKMLPYKDEEISSLDLVCTLPDGKFQSINSVKFHAQKIKQTLGIHFKYHFLRHTFATSLAEANVPSYLLKNIMGHSKIETTMRYYVSHTEDSVELLKAVIENSMN